MHLTIPATISKSIIWSHSKHEWCHQRAISVIRQAPLTLCPAMLTGRSVLREERKNEKWRRKKWISVEACSGNKEAFKTGSHVRAKLGEGEIIVLIYTIVHAFCWVRNRPLLDSQPHISHWLRGSNSLAGGRMKQQSLQCCNGKDMDKKIGLS